MNSDQRAQAIYEQGLDKVRTTPAPDGQKFPIGSRVHVRGVVDGGMTQWKRHMGEIGPTDVVMGKDQTGIVLHTYAHAFQGDNVKDYCLDIDGRGMVAWFDESRLRLIE